MRNVTLKLPKKQELLDTFSTQKKRLRTACDQLDQNSKKVTWGNLPKDIKKVMEACWTDDDFVTHLKSVYENLCCYCETKVRKRNVEHLWPKGKYPRRALDYANLHWCCRDCNQNKGFKFSKFYPVLNPYTDNPISDHYEFMEIPIYDTTTDQKGKGLILKPLTKRAEITFEYTELNNDEIASDRYTYFYLIKALLEKVETHSDQSTKKKVLGELKELQKGQYRSVINYSFEKSRESIL